VIIGAVSCPQPPLLLPGSTGRPVEEVESLRAACLAAIGELLASGPERITVIGASTASTPAGRPPLSIAVGSVLLSQAGCSLPVEQLLVPEDAPTEDCLQLGRAAAARAEAATGLLVLAGATEGRVFTARLSYSADPFGVWYPVCSWR